MRIIDQETTSELQYIAQRDSYPTDQPGILRHIDDKLTRLALEYPSKPRRGKQTSFFELGDMKYFGLLGHELVICATHHEDAKYLVKMNEYGETSYHDMIGGHWLFDVVLHYQMLFGDEIIPYEEQLNELTFSKPLSITG